MYISYSTIISFVSTLVAIMSTELDMAYQLYNVNSMDIADEESTINTSPLSSDWIWFDRLLSFLPMQLSRRSDGTKRSKFCNRCFCTILVIIFCLVVLFLIIILTVWIAYNMKIENSTIGSINDSIQISIYTASRGSILYYFYKKFNHPWHQIPSKFEAENNFQHAVKYRKCHKIAMICCILYDQIYHFFFFMLMTDDYGKWYTTLISAIIWDYAIKLPILLTVVTYYIICSKYHFYFSHFIHILESESDQELNIKDVLEKYKLLHESFKQDYPLSLQVCLALLAAFMALDMWRITYYVFNGDASALIDLCPTTLYIILYLSATILINGKYAEFDDKLWKLGDEYIIKDSTDVDKIGYNYFLQFVNKYPITIRIGNFTLTKANIILFIIGYAAARYASYSIQYFYYAQQ